MVRLSKDFHQKSETTVGIGPGDLLGGQYEVGELLGRGGMGAVYRAQDTLLNRPVALKVLPAFLGDSQRARESLRKEAARAIELSHPALARIYHFGLHQEHPFLVMEFLAGRTLAKLLDETAPLSVERALAILGPLAEGLDYAHARKLVHRDVKPGNILLREEGDAPVLIDFGIAGELRDQSTRTGHTGIGTTTGTLSYMSPEQVRGEAPDPSMDLYSLAAVAYEMLGGDPPFFRGDPLNVQYQIVNEAPPRIPGLPDQLMQALERGLAKRAEERYGSARELVEVLGGAPSKAVVPATLVLPRAPGDSHPGSIGSDPKAAATLVPHQSPARIAVALPENVRLHLLLGPLIGFFAGCVPAFLATGFWNVLALPALQQTPQFQEALANPWWLLLSHLLPPLVIGAAPFSLVSGVFARWLEEKRARAGLPFLLGVGLGVFLSGFTVVHFLPPIRRNELPVGAIAVVLVGLLSMFLVVGVGLVMLPESDGFEKEEVGTYAWWGGRLALMTLLPFFVALTGAVIGGAMPWPGHQLFMDLLGPTWDRHLLYPLSVHFLPWVMLVTPTLSLISRVGGVYLERKYPGTGFPLVLGLALALATNGLLCWFLGWFDTPASLGPQGIRYFVTSVSLGLGAGCIQILWAGREHLFSESPPPWLFALTVWATRLVCDFLAYLLVLEVTGLGTLISNELAALPTSAGFLALGLPFLLFGLATTAFLAHLFRPTPPRGDSALGDQLVAESFFTSPLLLWLICRSHPQSTAALKFWWPLLYGSLLVTLPGILLGRKALRFQAERAQHASEGISEATEADPGEPDPR